MQTYKIQIHYTKYNKNTNNTNKLYTRILKGINNRIYKIS